MVSHFEDRGFKIKNAEEFKNLLDRLIKKSKAKSTKKGEYFIYKDGKIEVWTLLSSKKGYLNSCPFFNGIYKKKIKKKKIIKNKKNLTVEISGLLKEREEEIPTIIEVPNYWLINSKLKKGKTYLVKITAFTNNVLFYSNEKDFELNDPLNKEFGKVKAKDGTIIKGFSPNYFSPVGTFEEIDDKTLVRFAGKIKEINKIKNKITNIEFYHITAKTLVGVIDVVCPSKPYKKKPKVGGILHGDFSLIGKFKIKEEPKKSFFERFTRKGKQSQI